MNIFKYLSCFTLLLSGMLVFAQEGGEEEETVDCHRMTLYIKCNSQGIVDKDWGLEFDVIGPDGKKINEEPIKVTIAKGTRVAAAANRVALGVNLHAGEENPANGPASTEETPDDSPLSKGDEHEKEDIKLKEGYKFDNIKKTCKGSDTKHLEARTWKRVKKKKKDDKDAETPAPIDKRALVTSVDVAPVVAPAPQPSTMSIALNDAFAHTLGVQLHWSGTYDDGTPYVANFEQYYDGTTPLDLITADLGVWALSEGALVTWDANNRLIIDFSNLGVEVTVQGFGMWMEFDADADDGVTYYVDFNMD